MKRYHVRLVVPTTMWAILEVEAKCEEEAIAKAFADNKAGTVSYEYSGYDNSDAELSGVEDEEV